MSQKFSKLRPINQPRYQIFLQITWHFCQNMFELLLFGSPQEETTFVSLNLSFQILLKNLARIVLNIIAQSNQRNFHIKMLRYFESIKIQQTFSKYQTKIRNQVQISGTKISDLFSDNLAFPEKHVYMANFCKAFRIKNFGYLESQLLDSFAHLSDCECFSFNVSKQ